MNFISNDDFHDISEENRRINATTRWVDLLQDTIFKVLSIEESNSAFGNRAYFATVNFRMVNDMFTCLHQW